MKHSFGVLLILLFFLVMCDTNPFHPDKESQPVDNQPPETYLFLFLPTDSTAGQDSLVAPGIATTPSKQIIHWWGEDKDGQVVG